MTSPSRAADHHTVIGKPKPEPRKKAKRRTSKSERKMLEAKLWKLTADYVKLRDGICITCGATEGLTMSHWIKAGKQLIRYDLRNVACQCSTCNNLHNYYPERYTMWMVKRWGVDVMNELTIKSLGTKWKWSVIDLRQMVAEAETRLNQKKGIDHDPAKFITVPQVDEPQPDAFPVAEG